MGNDGAWRCPPQEPAGEPLALPIPARRGARRRALEWRRPEDVQLTTGEGPCVDALRSGRPVLVPDLGLDPRWPAFVAAAREHGVSAYALDLPPEEALLLMRAQAFADRRLPARLEPPDAGTDRRPRAIAPVCHRGPAAHLPAAAWGVEGAGHAAVRARRRRHAGRAAAAGGGPPRPHRAGRGVVGPAARPPPERAHVLLREAADRRGDAVADWRTPCCVATTCSGRPESARRAAG
jgi:hypothetical protein